MASVVVMGWLRGWGWGWGWGWGLDGGGGFSQGEVEIGDGEGQVVEAGGEEGELFGDLLELGEGRQERVRG
jgi:hypothetical protein